VRAAIVCGSRDWTDVAMLRGTLAAVHAELGDDWLLVIEGDAPGADRMAGAWADEMIRQRVGHTKFPAEWKRYRQIAGPIRNRQMLRHLLKLRDERQADVEVIAFHDDIDRPRCGTRDMRDIAKAAGVRVKVHAHPNEICPECNKPLDDVVLIAHDDGHERHASCEMGRHA
jgi:hypothetical protein